MQYRKFGRTGLSISPIGLGTVNFSWLTNEADSFAILDKALERGVNFIDTSNNYNAGQTEALLGRWFAQGGRREQTVLATKVFSPPMEWGSKDVAKRTGSWVGPNERGLSAKNIRNAWHIAQAQELARQRPFMGLVSEQSLYNLARRTVELEVIPACLSYGLAFLPYSPLGGGALGVTPGSNEKGRRSSIQQSDKLVAYQQFCASIGHSPADVALAWLARQPGVTAPIIGPRTLAQFDASCAALDIALDEEAMTRLDELFPGPGGAAPEAYAW